MGKVNSRKALELLRGQGADLEVIEYLKAPPGRDQLAALVKKMGVPVRDVMRQKEAVYQQLGLDDPALSDAALIDAMVAHPVLINRPIVVTLKGARLCRPPEAVMDLLPD